jgi:hypothetical protein
MLNNINDNMINKINEIKSKINSMTNSNKKKKNNKKHTDNDNDNKQPIYDLALLCQFQNSATMLRSWLQHHIWQGVQHFFMIDDNSTDNSKEILQEFIENGVVTHFNRSGKKVDNYRRVFVEHIRGKARWLAICDVNDFFFGFNQKLVKMIKQHVAPHFDMVLCNRFCFECERQNELDNPVHKTVTRHSLLSKNTKYIFRVRSIIHPSQIWLETLVYPQSKHMMTKDPRTLCTNTLIRLNNYHYEFEKNEIMIEENQNMNSIKQCLVDTTLKDLAERTPENY